MTPPRTAPLSSVSEVIDLAAQPMTPENWERLKSGMDAGNDRIALACICVVWRLGRGKPVDFANLRYLMEGDNDRIN